MGGQPPDQPHLSEPFLHCYRSQDFGVVVPEGLAAYQCLEQKLLGQRAQAKHAHWQNGVRAWWCCPLPEQTNAWEKMLGSNDWFCSHLQRTQESKAN